MVHELQLIKVLLAIYQFVDRALEGVSFHLLAHVLMLLDNVMSLLKLLPLILDLLLILTILLQDHLFLLLHDILLLLDDLLDPGLYASLHLLELVALGCLRLLQEVLKGLVLVLELVDPDLVFHVLLLKDADLIVSLLRNDLTLGNFLDQLLILLIDVCNSFNLCDILAFHDLIFDIQS